MAKFAGYTGATAVAERPTDALWLAALPRIATVDDRLPVTRSAGQPAVRPAGGTLAGLPGAVTDMAVTADGRFLVAAHYGQDAISVIDVATLTVHATVAGIAEPYALAASNRVYVNSGALDTDSVVAIDLVSGVALAAKEIAVHARGLAVSPAGDTLYVARCADGAADIAVIDVESGHTAVIPLVQSGAATVDAVRAGADGKRLYAALVTPAGSALAVIDVKSRRVIHTIALNAAVGDIAVHRDGRRVVATGWDSRRGGVVSVVDTTSGRVVQTTAVDGMPTQAVVSSTRAYVVTGDRIAVIDLSAGQIVEGIEVDRPVSCVALSADHTRLYVADFDGAVTALTAAGAGQPLRAAS